MVHRTSRHASWRAWRRGAGAIALFAIAAFAAEGATRADAKPTDGARTEVPAKARSGVDAARSSAQPSGSVHLPSTGAPEEQAAATAAAAPDAGPGPALAPGPQPTAPPPSLQRQAVSKDGTAAAPGAAVASTPTPSREPLATREPASPRDSTAATFAYVGFGTAAVGVLVGTIAGAKALSNTSRLENDCPNHVCPSNKQSDIASTKNLAGISDISFALAVIGAVVGVNALVLSGDTDTTRATGLRARPMVGAGAVGVSGRF